MMRRTVSLAAGRRRPMGGFTLVEVLIAISLLSLLMLVLTGAMRALGQTEVRVEQRIDQAEQLGERTPEEITEPPPEPILSEREKNGAADHLVIAFPLWMGGMPAKLKAFFEQAARGGYFVKMEGDGWPEQMMKGKTARVLVSMAMPGPVYRFGMDEGALKALERGILGLSGFRQVHHTLIGGAQRLPPEDVRSWQTYCRKIGDEGA